MRITKFVAEGVHDYMNLSISFRDDYTFIIGLNGSGKTSALRLVMALLTPNFAELASLPFRRAAISILDGGIEKTIEANRNSDGLTLRVEGIPDFLELTATELQLLEQPPTTEDSRPPVFLKAMAHEVSIFISNLGTPMFLGLDRRFLADFAVGDRSEIRRRDFLIRRSIQDEMAIKKGNVAAGLADVNLLVHDTMSEIRQQQESLDTELRNKLLTGAFNYEPVGINNVQIPSRESLDQYREKQAEIENAVRSLQIPLTDVRAALEKFFERMNLVVTELEKNGGPKKRVIQERVGSKKKHRSYGAQEPPTDSSSKSSMMNESVIEWIVNKSQVDRITAHLELLSKYNEQRNNLREPIDRFLKLLNDFLIDTGKRVIVSEIGSLKVAIGGKDRPIGSLSSGERQLVVMLAHLALNKRLEGSGVFIVDEPELSLHISWQERFLDAIRKANPSVQIVMATHSPAIILDRDDHCESLDSNKGFL